MLNKRAKTLKGLMKCSRSTMRTVLEKNLGLDDLLKYNMVSMYGVTMENIIGYSGFGWNPDREVKRLSTFGIDMKTTLEYLFRRDIRMSDYIDYINDCIGLEKNIYDRHVARPKDFQREHQRIAALVKVKQSEVDAIKFRFNTEKITKMQEPFTMGGLLIRPARNAEELNKESEALGHCVRTYAQRVSDGKCAILFVRETEKPEKPYFTLELSPEHRIVQCRGKMNIWMPEEIKEFVDKWKGELYGIQNNT